MIFKLLTRQLSIGQWEKVSFFPKRTFGKSHSDHKDHHKDDHHNEEEPIVEPEGNLFNRIVINFLIFSLE